MLSYHVIPAGALTSAQLQEGASLATALQGAAPLTVLLDRTTRDGGPRAIPQLEFEGATNKAEVEVADILAGESVIHVINDMLLPAGIGVATGVGGSSGGIISVDGGA